mgnify:CR=1 FL=1
MGLGSAFVHEPFHRGQVLEVSVVDAPNALGERVRLCCQTVGHPVGAFKCPEVERLAPQMAHLKENHGSLIVV